MIKIEGVTKKFDGFTLQDISFELPKGYIMGLVGENGAGKTTLLNLILGVAKLDGGKILIDNMTYEDNEKEIRNLIGYVLVKDIFDGAMKLKDLSNMYGRYYENYKQELFYDYCKRFQLDINRKYKKLSKGEKLKFQFAFALSHQPKLLILDEPTASFDPEFREEFLKEITKFVADGEKSVLLATHMTEELDRIGDYITFLHKGKVKFSLERSILENKYRLVSGEEYKIKLIPKEKMIHTEKGKYATTALVEHTRFSSYSDGLEVSIPSVEELMYHMIKGEIPSKRTSYYPW